jgi:hypothetical protein
MTSSKPRCASGPTYRTARLALDARGDWYMRDERVQAAGPFPQVKGSRIRHDKLLAFIERNYAADENGAWYFQNGPQRVYVELEACPWVWRLSALPGAAPQLLSHTGRPAQATAAWVDESGWFTCRPTSAWGWCTAWTWRLPVMRSRPGCGRCTRRRRSPCQHASASSDGRSHQGAARGDGEDS